MRVCVPLIAFALLACGCGKPAEPTAPAPVTPPADTAVQPAPERAAQDGIRLPESLAAQPLGEKEEHVIFLNVNEHGKVNLMPDDQWKDAQGHMISTLDNSVQVENFLKRRAKEDRAAAGPRNKDKLRSLIVLRVHKDTPYEKTYAIMKAASKAGYERFQMRARRSPAGGAGQIALSFPKPDDGAIPDPLAEIPVRYTATVRSADNGTVEKITLREEGAPNLGTDLGPSTAALNDKLKAITAEHKGMAPKLTIEIDGKLLHAYVVQLLDAGIMGGFADVTPVHIDPAVR
jgi:biopolymer transport protein ExbD